MAGESRAKLDLFILAGEASGDRIGADLIARLRQRTSVNLSGVGGDEMMAAGLASIFPMADLAVMGISDVVRRLPLLLWRVEQVARHIVRTSPDVVVLIDAQEFSRLVAKRLSAKKFGGAVLLYVAPSVWARAPHRAKAYAPLFDEILAVLPFEPRVLSELGGPPTVYVGHPALAEIQPPPDKGADHIAVLPGSREGEFRRHLPLMRSAVEALADQHPGHTVFLPSLRSTEARLRAAVANWPVPVRVVSDRAERRTLYARTRLAIASAGTATLELALAGVPTIAVYVMDPHQARVFAKLGRPRVSLPNIILAEDLVPEFILDRPEPDAVVAAALELARSEPLRQRQVDGFARLVELMQQGEPGEGRHDPAERVLARLK
jgi:lipid-A-disaccharide synthase